MEARSLRAISVDAYVELDRSDAARWEYANGEASAMAGGSPEHALVAGNLFAALRVALGGSPCLAFHEAQKIATVRTQAYHYPDVSVVCPPFSRDARDDHAFTGPVALFEVLSPSTRDYDRGGKFLHYRTLATLEEYVLVDPETREIEHRRRVAANQWLSTFLREGDGDLALPALRISIAPSVLWRDLDRIAPAPP